MQVDVIGLNCATGPAEMGEPLRHLSANSRVPDLLPAQRRPALGGGRQDALRPDPRAAGRPPPPVRHRARASRPSAAAAGPPRPTWPRWSSAAPAPSRPTRHPVHEPSAASIYTAVPFHQDTSFLVVGERTNANGSKRFREAMLAGDWDTCVAMARDQVKEGAHLIDVCVDYTGADGVADMAEVASRFATQSSVPLMVDSTEGPVVRAALEWLGGRPVLNSVNLEEGDAEGTRLDTFLRLAREFGAAVVCTCIDEEGQARTADWKVRAARAIHDIAVDRYGLEASDLLFDPLALPLSTGMEESRKDGIETIEGIRRIKAELPGVSTILGLSNVSFGLNPAARQVLNSVFLHECVEAGLDAAIVHASKILPLSRIDERAREVCLDLVYDRRQRGLRPPPGAARPVRGGVGHHLRPRGAPRLAGRAPAGAADHRRQPQRAGGRPRRGPGRRPPGAGHRQRLPAGRDEDGRRPVRLGRDAAPLRPPVGRDHEVGRGPPRAPHGEVRPGRQGDGGAGHREGRRPRHRQEPGRHHLHQQRLRGGQPGHQGRGGRDDRRRRGATGPTPSA